MKTSSTAEALSPQIQAVLARIEAKRDEVVALTQDLVRIPTVNPPGDAYEACARYIGERLKPRGFAVEYVRALGPLSQFCQPVQSTDP